MKLTTTLGLLRQHNACSRGYNLIANHVGRNFAGQIDLLTSLEVNGISDCAWALRAAEQPEMREFAIEFAIKCAMPYCIDPEWQSWAISWLDGSDRSREAARAAAAAAAKAAEAAWEAEAAWAAAKAAEAAAKAAWAAAKAAAEAEYDRQSAIMRELLTRP